MFLRLGERTYDLTTRSLVVAVLDARSPDLVGRARALAAAGADLVELVHPGTGPGCPIGVRARSRPLGAGARVDQFDEVGTGGG
jgi:hypothetical protein